MLLVFAVAFANTLAAQSGGKQREKSNAKRSGRMFKRVKSPGNADAFASGKGRRGFFARLFKKPNPSWSNRSSGSVKSHRRANRSLFRRDRTKGKAENEAILDRQNADRAKRRIRGNKVFSKKKY